MLYRPKFKTDIPPSATRTKKNNVVYATWTGRKDRKITAEIKVDAQGNEYVNAPTATWYARYTDSQGRHIQRNTKCTGKSAAKSVLNGWLSRSEKVKAGYIRAADEHTDRRGPVSLGNVLDEYAQVLTQAGRTDKHVKHIKRVVQAVTDQSNITRLIDFTRRAVEVYLATLQDDGKSARTRNHHKALLSGFGVYCVRHGYLESNPAAHIEGANQATDRRHIRRALTEEEIALLLDAAERRPLADFLEKNTGTVKKIKPATKKRYLLIGRERRLVYETLLTTAARWSELRAVTVADCVLDGNAPHILLKAAATKNRRADNVPLTTDLAAKLKAWVKDSARIGKASLFDMPANGVKPFNRDLVFAGLASATVEINEDGDKITTIHKTNDQGEVLDIHCLRHTAATRLARAGVPVSVAQRILRHSDPKLTMSLYTHLGILDTAAAVESLPVLGTKAGSKKKIK